MSILYLICLYFGIIFSQTLFVTKQRGRCDKFNCYLFNIHYNLIHVIIISTYSYWFPCPTCTWYDLQCTHFSACLPLPRGRLLLGVILSFWFSKGDNVSRHTARQLYYKSQGKSAQTSCGILQALHTDRLVR